MKAGEFYYNPKAHQVLYCHKVSGTTAICGQATYHSDARTITRRVTIDPTAAEHLEHIADPATYPHLEHDGNAWRTIKDGIVCQEAAQTRLSLIANMLQALPDVHEVYVFGSVARAGTGHDFDIIATVDETVFELWATMILRELNIFGFEADGTDTSPDPIWGDRDFDAYYSPDLREHMACRVLHGLRIETLRQLAFFDQTRGKLGYPLEWGHMNIDLFLFPPDWMDRLEELQAALPHQDQDFMVKIARDARVI